MKAPTLSQRLATLCTALALGSFPGQASARAEDITLQYLQLEDMQVEMNQLREKEDLTSARLDDIEAQLLTTKLNAADVRKALQMQCLSIDDDDASTRTVQECRELQRRYRSYKVAWIHTTARGWRVLAKHHSEVGAPLDRISASAYITHPSQRASMNRDLPLQEGVVKRALVLFADDPSSTAARDLLEAQERIEENLDRTIQAVLSQNKDLAEGGLDVRMAARGHLSRVLAMLYDQAAQQMDELGHLVAIEGSIDPNNMPDFDFEPGLPLPPAPGEATQPEKTQVRRKEAPEALSADDLRF